MDYQLSNEYVAGFFDGEGCVLIRKVGGRAGYYKSHIVAAVLGQTNLPILEALRERWGGSVRSRKGTTKPFWEWQIVGPPAVNFLVELLPHLKLKQEQAQLAVDFRQVLARTRPASGTRLSEEGYLEREAWARRLVQLRKPIDN